MAKNPRPGIFSSCRALFCFSKMPKRQIPSHGQIIPGQVFLLMVGYYCSPAHFKPHMFFLTRISFIRLDANGKL
ncbi:unnamed protein product [Linum trigynum]|uniref:Uncharacterized protein n=1 Tax=Linum trigynum TaxID=586398 RepID=A0AAV2EVL9_9ROSI